MLAGFAGSGCCCDCRLFGCLDYATIDDSGTEQTAEGEDALLIENSAIACWPTRLSGNDIITRLSGNKITAVTERTIRCQRKLSNPLKGCWTPFFIFSISHNPLSSMSKDYDPLKDSECLTIMRT
jgi:hypothetical protein